MGERDSVRALNKAFDCAAACEPSSAIVLTTGARAGGGAIPFAGASTFLGRLTLRWGAEREGIIFGQLLVCLLLKWCPKVVPGSDDLFFSTRLQVSRSSLLPMLSLLSLNLILMLRNQSDRIHVAVQGKNASGPVIRVAKNECSENPMVV